MLKVDNESVARYVQKLVNLPVTHNLILGGTRLMIPTPHALSSRTATVYRTLEPFWGEEYTLHVPNEFQAVSVHVFDYDLMG